MKNALDIEGQLNGLLWKGFKEFIEDLRREAEQAVDEIEPIDEANRYEREKAIITRRVLKGLPEKFERVVKEAALEERTNQ